MKAKELEKLGGFISSEPVIREIKWEREFNGEQKTEEFKIGVVRPAYAEMEKVLSMSEGSRTAELISLCVRLGEKLEEKITYEMACRLEPNLAAQFAIAVKSVNNLDEKEKK
jgi:hypothetical protein